MNCLVDYDSSDSDGGNSSSHVQDMTSTEEQTPIISLPQKPITHSSIVPMVNAAPEVLHKAEFQQLIPVDPTAKELTFNPRYEEMFALQAGPENPFKTERQKAAKNMLTGLVEPTNMHDFTFENQWRTFMRHGYAYDPSSTATTSSIIGDQTQATLKEGLTAFENSHLTKSAKRKRAKNMDASDVEGYTGPWAKYEDEQTEAVPSEEDQAFLTEYLAKKAANKKRRGPKAAEETPLEEKSTLHLASPVDYQGRSFLVPPSDQGVNLKSDTPPKRCYLPKRLLHEWTNAHQRGVACIRLFPHSGHLLLSGGMDNTAKLWELYGSRRLIRTYTGHSQALKDACFNATGTEFLTCSYDRSIKLWNTETGQCLQRFTTKKMPHCIKFNPDADKQHFFLAGCADRKIYCFDTRSGEMVQQYDRHLAAVNTITFVDNNRRFVSTSDDKSLRVWEWDIPVDFKCLQDPSMHSMPAVTLSDNGKWLVCQSADNQMVVYNALASFKKMKKTFRGHMCAGFACEPCFSPDLNYIVSGDGEGRVFIWDWKTSRQLTRWAAHEKCCISAQWLPHETSKLVTCGWDGTIKLWD